MSKHLTLQDQATEFLLYTAPNGKIKVEVLLSNVQHEPTRYGEYVIDEMISFFFSSRRRHTRS